MKNITLKSLALMSILVPNSMMIGLQAAEKPQYYRFKDESGRYIVSNILPPEYANKGYDIISTRGNVIKHIARKKTATEAELEKSKIQSQKQAELQKSQALKQRAAQRKKDQLLLRMFSSISDIERSRDEKISAIEVLESITQDNIKRQNIQLEKSQARADLSQKNGAKISKLLQSHLEKTSANIQDSQDFLTRKQKEKEQINRKYNILIERFEKLNINKRTEDAL